MNKYEVWWDSLSPQMQKYIKEQPVWRDKDLYKSLAIGVVIGFLVGLVVGYEWAWRPVEQSFRPLIG
jgi:Na+/H+-dicarboxylate symporter